MAVRNLLARIVATTLLLATAAAHAQQYEVTELGTLGFTYNLGDAINASGQITGYVYGQSGPYQAFLYGNGNMQEIGTLGGTDSFGLGINTRSLSE